MTDILSGLAAMRPVALDSIERELDNMWRETNASIAATGGHAYSRNSVLTLVVYSMGRGSAESILDVIHGLTNQHPSRAIVVAADPADQGQSIEARVSTFVTPGSQSYGEDIVVEAQREAVPHLPGVVLPLIVSGLPSFLWWTGEPPWGSELLESLVDGCDRLIVDTAEMTRPEASVTALDDLMRRKKSRCAVGDMCWAAQAPWRDIVAGFFDPPNLLPYLEGIERVTIEYAAGEEDGPVNRSQAALFAGWLASRLGWHSEVTQASGVDSSLQYTLHDANNKRVALELNARYGVPQRIWWTLGAQTDVARSASGTHIQGPAAGAWVRPGALMSVYLAARLNGGPRATFAVARERDLMHATTASHVPEYTIPSQTVHLQSVGELTPITDELQRLGHDMVFEDALDSAAELLRPIAKRNGR
jgi:glucose-6-phosphate dehydrogenase assembly protein OpcA